MNQCRKNCAELRREMELLEKKAGRFLALIALNEEANKFIKDDKKLNSAFENLASFLKMK